MNLASRIAAIGLVGLAVFALFLLKGIEWAASAIAADNTDAYLSAYADVLIPAIRIHDGTARVMTDNAVLAEIPRDWQISQAGVPLQRSQRLTSWLPLLPAKAAAQRFRNAEDSQSARELIQRDYLFPGDATVTVTFGMDAALADAYTAKQRSTLRERLLPLLLIAALTAALLLSLQVAVIIWPLNRLRRDIAGLEQGRTRQLSNQYPQELRRLTNELNQQLKRSDSMLTRYRQFASNLSHAIKTPLTALRLEATTTSERVLLDRIDAMLERNLARTRIAGVDQGSTVATNIEPLLLSLVRSYRKLSEVEITLQVEHDLIFQGDAQDFVEAIGNILENACRYGAQKVDVRADPGLIVVSDDGPGVATAERENILRRGTRLDEVNPGTGIGLPISVEIVELYGGSISLLTSDAGGLKVSIRLPISQSPSKS